MDKNALFALGLIVVFCFIQLTAQPPSRFDLRDSNMVTPVKSQKSGTCWCHGTMSGVEGNLLYTGNWWLAGESGDPNMAEYHLSWWNGFSECWNYDLYPECDTGSGTPTHNGGDYKIFCAYMSRLEGPIRESDAPGDNYASIPNQTVCPLYKDTYRIWYIPDINWYFIDGDGGQGSLQKIDTIKYVCIRNGVMPTNYLVTSGMGTWDSLKTHYQAPTASGDANHSVAIVGWDDACETPAGPSMLGAWLCKNSWGTYPSQQPYFWISYYDKHCCRNEEMSVVSFHDVQPVPYTGVYYHDYHGWRDTLTSAKEGFNKFVADNTVDEYLIDVSFITTVDHDNWEVKVYDNFTGGELQDELASASGSITHMGYHTRKLDKPVTLTDGDDFYIYVGFEKGFQAYDRTCSPPVLTETPPKAPIVVWSKAEQDQSYYRTSPTSAWTDLYEYEETITVEGNEYDCQGSQNLCIKGFVIDTIPIGIEFTPTLPNTRFQLFNYPNPFTSQTTIQYTVNNNSTVSIEIFNARGSKIYSFANAKQNAGIIKTVWNGKDKYNNPLPSGVYYAVLTVKTGNSVMSEKKRMFLMK